MAYEIPYDSNYNEWYGTPQNVTRLSAVLEQTLDEDGNAIGLITASWNMPDNGGTFVAQLSTDGTTYYVAETGIQGNSVVLTVPADTDYYIKIITVLGGNQSTGTASSLMSASVTLTPPTPIVSAVQGGMQINVGAIPVGYRVEITINDGTDDVVLYATEIITTYNCNSGTYTVSTAYVNASNVIGTSSTSASVTVSELAVAGDFVEKTSADYIKSASVSGDTLTLTQGNDNTVTFQGGSYTLPIASSSTLGGIKVGTNLSIDSNGVLSASGGSGGGDVTTNTDQTITGVKTFVGQKRILFKQSTSTDKLGFTLYTNSDVEKGYLEFNPSNTVDSVPLMTIGNYATASAGLTHVGFRKYSNISGASGAYNLLAPLISDARTPFNLTTTYTNFYLPLGVTDGTTTVKTAKSGLLDISSLLPIYSDFVGSGSSAAHGLVPAPPSTAGTSKYLREDGSWATPSGGGGGGGSYTAGDGIDITSDVISLETASANDIGGIKVGSGLSIDANGVLSAIGGGGSGYSETELYSNSSGVNSGTITLNDNISNYDLICFYTGGSSEEACNICNVSEFIQRNSANKYYLITRWDDYFLRLYYNTDTQITFPSQSGHVTKIVKIIGVKCGGGGLSPSDITTGTTNGTISVDGTDVSVHGLGSNAFDSTSYLPLTGGELTGAVSEVMADPSTRTAYTIKYSDITRGTAPAAAKEGYQLKIVDKEGTSIGGVVTRMPTDGSVAVRLANAWSAYRAVCVGTNAVFPYPDATVSLGRSNFRWTDIYATNATINTSDERAKSNIDAIPDEVLDAWADVEWCQFKFRDAVKAKGKRARLHTGAIAQRIKAVFEKHNIDPFAYGLLCYDKWDAEEEHRDEDGNLMEEAREAGNRYSLRYEEALCMESAYQRRRADRLEERIEALERAIMC